MTENPELIFTRENNEMLICPSFVTGGKDWEAGAYSPITNKMYFPLRNACARMLAIANGSLYNLSQRIVNAPGTDQVGTVRAIDASTGETTWLHEQRAGTTSLMATAGGLVFGGDSNGRFRAHDHETGEVLWEVNLGSQVTGFPITFAVDGTQYVATSTGSSHEHARQPAAHDRTAAGDREQPVRVRVALIAWRAHRDVLVRFGTSPRFACESNGRRPRRTLVESAPAGLSFCGSRRR